MDGVQGAVLGVKLPHLEAWTEARRHNAAEPARQRRGHAGGGARGAPPVSPRDHVYVVRLPQRDLWRQRLTDAGIQTGVHYPIPVHLQPAYRDLGYEAGDFPVAERAAAEVLSLPMFLELAAAQIGEVAGVIRAGAAAGTTAEYARVVLRCRSHDQSRQRDTRRASCPRSTAGVSSCPIRRTNSNSPIGCGATTRATPCWTWRRGARPATTTRTHACGARCGARWRGASVTASASSRGAIARHPETFEIGDGVVVGEQAFIQGRFDGRCVIGEHAWLGPQSYFDARDLVLGSYRGVGSGARVLGSQHTGSPADVPVIQTDLRIEPVRVEDWADVGVNAVLMPGVTVGRGAIVGAGAVVTRDVTRPLRSSPGCRPDSSAGATATTGLRPRRSSSHGLSIAKAEKVKTHG